MPGVPFFSGQEATRRQWPRIEPVLREIVENGRFTDGPVGRRLERRIEAFTGIRHAVGVGNGSDAIVMALYAAGVGPGDEVAVPAYTFFATASAVAHVGATPVFVDIEPDTYAMDPEALERAITPRTRVVMPVHLFHQMADMQALTEVAEAKGVTVIEDSAEGIGMWLDGRHAGHFGLAGVLSFFPTKTLGALGDAGMVLTDDDGIAETCRAMRMHGRDPRAPHMATVAGLNSRLDEIQAAVLLARLDSLDEEIARRALLAERYTSGLAHIEQFVRTPVVAKTTDPAGVVFYVYLIRARDRDGLVDWLTRAGIGTEVYYPQPLPRQPCFAHLESAGQRFPVSEEAATEVVALPLYPDLTFEQVDTVCDAIDRFYATHPVTP